MTPEEERRWERQRAAARASLREEQTRYDATPHPSNGFPWARLIFWLVVIKGAVILKLINTLAARP